MRYWEEMQGKWGFGDGDAVPDGAEEYRKVYIEVVNAFAEQLGSDYHYVTFDRPGMHNWCLVIIAKNGTTDDEARVAEVDPGGDEALQNAVSAAYDFNVDDFVEIDVTINEHSLGILVERIKKGLEEPADGLPE